MTRRDWLAKRLVGLIAMVLGVLSFAVVAIVQPELWTTPDWRLSVPGFALTAIAAGISMVRREPAWTFWLVGLGLAGSAIVLGYFLMLAIIVAATLIVLLILHSVM